MATQIQLRRDTAANWTAANPVLAQGEPGYETDTGKLKVGNGSSAWNSLSYQAAAAIVDGTIVNDDVNASAAIAGTKISPDFGAQNLTTTGTSTAASFIPTSSTVPTNGVYLPAANSVGISTGGSGNIFFRNGRIGVGESNPSGLIEWRSTNIGRLEADASVVTINAATNAPLVFKQNDTERMRLTATGLGIGTSAVQSQLSVVGPVGTLNDTGGTLLVATDASGTDAINARGAGITFAQRWQNASGAIRVAGIYGVKETGTGNYGGSLSFYTQPNSGADMQERMRLTSTGLGIGNTAPGDMLTVGTNSAGGNIRINSSSAGNNGVLRFFASDAAEKMQLTATTTDAVLYTPAGISLSLQVANSERARIDSSGRLLVGTSSSSASAAAVLQGFAGSSTGQGILQLQVGKNTAATGVNENLGSVRFANSDGNIGAWISGEADLQWNSGDYPSRLVFSTCPDSGSSPVERMRISQNGTVSIGTTTSSGAPAEAGITFDQDGASRARIGSNGNYISEYYNASGTLVGYVQVNSGSVTYSTTSDYRLKENLEPLTGALERLEQLAVYRFNFTADPDNRVDGFVAHEVQAVVPEAISGQKDAINEDGSIKPQGIDQSKLVPLLTAALQEAVAKIERLEARLTAAGI